MVNPDDFIKHRSELVVIQSDQMPVYAKIRPDKQLYTEAETRAPGTKSVLSLLEKLGDLSGGHSNDVACHEPAPLSFPWIPLSLLPPRLSGARQPPPRNEA